MKDQSFCDWEPCRLMQEFIKKYALPQRPPATVQSLICHPRKTSIPNRILTFYYCPFCGTRLHDNKEILEWISEGRTA